MEAEVVCDGAGVARPNANASANAQAERPTVGPFRAKTTFNFNIMRTRVTTTRPAMQFDSFAVTAIVWYCCS